MKESKELQEIIYMVLMAGNFLNAVSFPLFCLLAFIASWVLPLTPASRSNHRVAMLEMLLASNSALCWSWQISEQTNLGWIWCITSSWLVFSYSTFSPISWYYSWIIVPLCCWYMIHDKALCLILCNGDSLLFSLFSLSCAEYQSPWNNMSTLNQGLKNWLGLVQPRLSAFRTPYECRESLI